MQINDKLIKPIYEVNYLRAENVDRYRMIIRYFYLEYEKIHNWLHKEDVYEEIHKIEGYENYTLEQCQQDLQMLVNWGNLTTMQDSNKVRTIEDFKNKKYRYQLSEYTVEIERMTIRLENLEIEGASLEPTLLERIYKQILQISNIKSQDDMNIHGWLQLLMNDFVRLNQNYQDYIKMLNSAKAEELMKTTEFLVYKDKIIMYLRTFVMEMQNNGNLIASVLMQIDISELEIIFQKAAQYEISIPRIGYDLNEKEVYQNFKEKWASLHRWFVGEDGSNEMDKLYEITNEIIRKMTRYAQQISEMINRGSNRKEQYQYIADIFTKCENIEEAHCLSAYVFGVEDCLHLTHIQPRLSEDIHMGVYQESPSSIRFDPHSRIVRKKTLRKPAKDYSLERKMNQLELEAELAKQKESIQKLIINGEIDFASLPKIDSSTRKTLLIWLSKALAQESLSSKTDYGDHYYIDKSLEKETCVLHCQDGDFLMPSFKIVFKEAHHE
ncbi:TIGR02677 family protein [Candidatus Stoquefichus massiliensis]|uniref:TIGR02677 family protein n=1 Tax=Candidatus Stoquefichus massiliensis TaxID=1470350 RepID=UPI00047F9587|nr:TIGR02677 family protein [Candidatus Stoquefichus massiliensis]